jgi:hypothetical protein
VTDLVIVTRTEWGSQATTPTQQPDAKRELFVHHVAGRWPVSLEDERRHMRELQTYALSGKGGRYPPGTYSDMDYNAAIGPSGTLYEGRGFFARSAATLDRNDVSRAIVLMGNTDTKQPTPEQLWALPRAAKHLIDIGSLRRDVTIYGHFENPAHPNATSCPGRYMVPNLPGMRIQLAQLLTPTPPPEADVKYLRVRVPGDPTRAEALVLLDIRGFNTPAERDAVTRVLATEDRPVTAAQYDALLAVFGV